MNKIEYRKSNILVFSRNQKLIDFVGLICDNFLFEHSSVVIDSLHSLKPYLVEPKDMVFIDGCLVLDQLEEVESLLLEKSTPHILILDKETSLILDNEYSFTLVDEGEKTSLEQVISSLSHFFKSLGFENLIKPQIEFKSVRTRYLLRFNKTKADLYIKIGKEKFIKLINAYEFYEAERIKRYQDKNLDFLYMKKQGVIQLSKDMRLLPYLSYEKPPEVSESEFRQIKATQILSLCKDIFRDGSESINTSEIAESYVSEVEDTASKEKLILKNLKRMKERAPYFSEHSYIIGFTVSHMVRFLDETYRANRKKLITAGLFHDLLVLDPRLIEIQNKKDPRCRMFSNDILKEYFNHPIKTSEIIKKSGLYPDDLARIILEHHENPQATGFPSKKGPNAVSTLSAVFNVAHAFSELIFQGIFDEVYPEKAFALLEAKFDEGFYKNAVVALKKALSMDRET
jgi:HD-GYP domain-containing protein (c-di-GMP phosphodiesterase class II)